MNNYRIAIVYLLLAFSFSCDKFDLVRSNPHDPKSSNYTPDLPILLTNEPSSISVSEATLGGNITDNGGGEITARGICWATTENPTIVNNKTTDGTGGGSFISKLIGLRSGEVYYARAYATNKGGTAYGNQIVFLTVLEDIVGNIYNTVQIGTQLWMAENLRTTKYRDGTDIPNVQNVADWAALTTGSLPSEGAYCWYDNMPELYKNTYGALYSETAVYVEVCPTGWHIPSSSEVIDMLKVLDPDTGLPWGAISQIAGGKLKESGTAHWVFPNADATNETGFTALPGGIRYSDGTFSGIGLSGTWFMDRSYSNFSMSNQYAHVTCSEGRNELGRSVRCVKD